MKGIKPHNAAAREALEEAGILGKVAKSPLGGYSYAKRLENGSVQICQVQVFAPIASGPVPNGCGKVNSPWNKRDV